MRKFDGETMLNNLDFRILVGSRDNVIVKLLGAPKLIYGGHSRSFLLAFDDHCAVIAIQQDNVGTCAVAESHFPDLQARMNC